MDDQQLNWIVYRIQNKQQDNSDTLCLGDFDKPDKNWIKCDSIKTRDKIIYLAKKFTELENKYFEELRIRKARESSDRVNALIPIAANYTDEEINDIIDKWQSESRGHSFEHTMLSGKSFEKLLAVPKDRIVPFLLRRLMDGYYSMSFQFFLRRLTNADIGSWSNPVKGIRAYNVEESAKLWIKWGLENNIIK